MNIFRNVKLVTSLALGGSLCFVAGFFVSERFNQRLVESIYYTDLLTEARWSITMLEAIENGRYREGANYARQVLRMDIDLLVNLESEGRLGSEGVTVLAQAREVLNK